MKKILVAEDEAHVAAFIKRGLTEENYDVSVAFDGLTAVDMFRQNDFDLVVLDIMMPGINGYEACRIMKQHNKLVPVLFLSALGTSENIVLGLDTGGDDYLVKPFKFIELLARVRSLLRRTELLDEKQEPENPELLKLGDLEMDDRAKAVRRGRNDISLTATEYRLLQFLLKNAGKVLSRVEILDEVWGVNFDMGTNVVDVYVNYLRKKIDAAYESKLIHTVVGMGYVLRESD